MLCKSSLLPYSVQYELGTSAISFKKLFEPALQIKLKQLGAKHMRSENLYSPAKMTVISPI